jgi:hypothetical protein
MTNPEIVWYINEELKSLTPLAIGSLGIYIAVRQWLTSRHKLKLDLFDRRFGVYKAAREVLNHLVTKMDFQDEARRKFYRDIEQADFLFPPKVSVFLRQLAENAVLLHRTEMELSGAISLYDSEKATDMDAKQAAVVKWILETDKTLVNRFKPYLGLNRIK